MTWVQVARSNGRRGRPHAEDPAADAAMGGQHLDLTLDLEPIADDGVQRSWARVVTRRRTALVIQFGGASGTMAALDEKGLDVAEALARELSLSCPDAPWHSYGDRLAAMVAASAIYTGVLGKMARDISLLMQAEVGEAREAGGGSSAMPHKRPAGCAVALASAARMPALMSTVLTSLVQEHERAAGTWHAQWPAIIEAVQVMGAAAEAMRQVASELAVDPARMRANLDATNGAIFAERVVMRLDVLSGGTSRRRW
jgi:3-carboxy-cis,cis-muconate cycloisomerase